jgi:ATP-dependent helicase/DNAse subunit B
MPELTLTNSSKTAFACPYKYYLSYVLMLKSKIRKEPMELGSLIHEYLEWYNKFGIDETLKKIGTITDRRHTMKMKALATLKKYVDWDEKPVNLIAEKDYKIFLFEIDGFQVYSCGKMDGIDNDNRQLIEYKTTEYDLALSESNSQFNFWHDIEHNPQHVGYYQATQKLGYDIKEVLYIALSRHEIKLKNNEEIEEYIERYYDKVKIVPYPIQINDIAIENYLEHERKIASEIIWNYKTNTWNRRPSLCSKPYRCEFFEHCKYGVDIADAEFYERKEKQHEELDIEETNNVQF